MNKTILFYIQVTRLQAGMMTGGSRRDCIIGVGMASAKLDRSMADQTQFVLIKIIQKNFLSFRGRWNFPRKMTEISFLSKFISCFFWKNWVSAEAQYLMNIGFFCLFLTVMHFDTIMEGFYPSRQFRSPMILKQTARPVSAEDQCEWQCCVILLMRSESYYMTHILDLQSFVGLPINSFTINSVRFESLQKFI